MSWLQRLRRRRHKSASLPQELMLAIDDVGVTFRSFVEDEDGIQTPRPLSMSFLAARAIYLDDYAAVSKVIRRHFPELTDREVRLAFSLITRRVELMREDQNARRRLLGSKRARRGAWMDETLRNPLWD